MPIFVFEGGQRYTRHFVLYIMDPIQIIVNIYAERKNIEKPSYSKDNYGYFNFTLIHQLYICGVLGMSIHTVLE